ncbi:MAG: hypothetical protein AAF411_08105 [Myxococcota bacterium]
MHALRRAARGAFFVLIAGAQVFFVVRAYSDPHSRFGYQPFSESSTWQATIVRVLPSGERVDIRQGWAGYSWEALMPNERGLRFVFERHNASGGIASTLDFFQRALDWAALNTPADQETVHLEAHVRYWQNTRGPTEVLLRSVPRRQP